MSTAPNPAKFNPIIEWITWSAISIGVIVLYFNFGQRPYGPEQPITAPSALALVGLGPLVASIALRWLLLPRMPSAQKRFPLFIVGLALAEACGILGIFLGGEHKDTLFTLSLLGLAQYFPAFLPSFKPPVPSFR